MTRAAVCVAVILWCVPARAQSFTSRLSSASVEEGEGVRFTLKLEGAKATSRPHLKLQQGAHATGAPRTSTMHSFNGAQMTSSTEFTYTIGFSKPGTFTIGPATIRTDRGTLSVAATKVVVRKAGSTKDLLVFAKLDSARAYVGQPVVATLDIAFARQAQDPDIRAPFLNESGEMRVVDPLELAQKWQASIDRTRRGLPGHQILNLADPATRVIASVTSRTIEGVPYSVYSVRRLLIPQRAGKRDFGPARAAANMVTGYRRGRSPFDDPFFGGSRRAVTKAAIAYSDPVSLDVVNMPAAGRPDGYEGAIGSYELSAGIVSHEVMLGGSPIILTLTVRGKGNLETVGAPALVGDDEFRTGTPEQKQEMRFENDSLVGTKTYVLPLRPRSLRARAVPAARLVVFDPERDAYRVLTTRPIPITVTAPENTGATESVALPPDPTEAARDAAPVRLDIEDIETDRDPTDSHRAWLHSPSGVVLFVVLPTIIYAALAVYAARVRRLKEDVGLARKLSALSRAAKDFETLRHEAAALDGTDFASRLSRVCQTYLADVFRRPTGELSAREAERLLTERGVDEALTGNVVGLLESADAARFGGAGLDTEQWLRRVETCIESLEKELK